MATAGSAGAAPFEWRTRVATAEEAVSVVRPGDHVFVGTACATPRTLIRALEDAEADLPGVQLIHFLTDGAVPVYKGGAFTRFRHKTFFVGSDMRAIVNSGRADYVPISVAQVHRLIENGRIPIDVALIQVTPPDEHGQVSLGVSVDVTRTAALKARRVIAEVNPYMPHTGAESLIPCERIDRFVEVQTPVIEYLHEPADVVAEQVARYVARIIADGSTLQIGLGRVPNEMLKYLSNRRDLGIHSDVITEPIVDLIARGVVTGARKTVHPGKVVASYCMGTRRLYDLVDGNPDFLFQSIHQVCDPVVIARNARMVSVTQAFAIDLTGQVCADQFEGEFYGGVSTQAEFLRGAARASEGKPIVCLASTTDDGRQSRIRSLLREGEGVTVARSDVHYVITEYGIAYLFGKSVRERAMALIEVAHPSFRQHLLDEGKRLGYLPAQQTLKNRSAYPTEEERWVTLKNDARVLLRPTRASDVEAMQDLFYRLDPGDVYTRFFTNLKSLTISHALHLCNVGYEDEMAFAAVVGDWEDPMIVGSSCYYLDHATNLADVAYLMHPEWQGVGLGSVLQQCMIEYARARGVRGFTADVLNENERMISVFRRSGFPVTLEAHGGVREVRILFD